MKNGSNTYNDVNDGREQMHEKNCWMNVLKLIFYNADGTLNWMECYCLKTGNVLLILSSHAFYCKFIQQCQYEWQKQQIKLKTTKKKKSRKVQGQ